MDLMEHVRRSTVDSVKLLVPGAAPLEGSMCVTAFFLIYSTRKQESQDEITILHTMIDQLEHRSLSVLATLHLKDFRHLQFEFSSPEDCQDMMDALSTLSKPERLQQLYAFVYCPRSPLPASPWHFASPRELMVRWQCSEERWRVSRVNKGFQVCPSYPQEVIVPQSVSDEDLKKVALFRHLRRFPILCFHHKRNQAVLIRCGQPLCGSGSVVRRCKEDVQLLNACLPSLNRGKILDIRPQTTAQNHMSKGGGVELPSHYPNWKVEHAKTDPPNIILASLNKLMEACGDPSLVASSGWFGRLEASGWLSHVSRLLHAARFTSLCIHRDASSVVVHGAGSRDATLQVTSLVQILLDSHCRTMEGFVELIQCEWMDAGHPFSLRHSHVTSAPDTERAPMFLLFLDAVWQMTQQFPLSFEFNETFLHTLFVHSYSSCYGNFLYDTPQERHKQKLHEKTASLWDYLSQPEVQEALLNPVYERNSSVLLISVNALTVTLWKRLYLRTDISLSLSLPGHSAMRRLKETSITLKQSLNDTRRELLELQLEGRRFVSGWS